MNFNRIEFHTIKNTGGRLVLENQLPYSYRRFGSQFTERGAFRQDSSAVARRKLLNFVIENSMTINLLSLPN
jgi:hypothetical protein